MAVDNQLQFVAILIPILAVLIAVAADSVEEDESPFYRAFVFLVGTASIGPIAIASLLGILSVGTDVSSTKIIFNAGLSITLAVVLVLGVTLHETMRGMDDDDYLWILGAGTVVAIFYIVLYYFGP